MDKGWKMCSKKMLREKPFEKKLWGDPRATIKFIAYWNLKNQINIRPSN